MRRILGEIPFYSRLCRLLLRRVRRLKGVVVSLDSMPLHANAGCKPLELLLAAAGRVIGEKRRFMDINSPPLEMFAQTFWLAMRRILGEIPFYSRLCRLFLRRVRRL